MKEMNYTYRILDLLKAYPNGLRLRSIGAKLGVWHPSLAKDIAELERKGQVIGLAVYCVWEFCRVVLLEEHHLLGIIGL